MRSVKTLITVSIVLILLLAFTACGEVTITYKTGDGAVFGTEKLEKGTGTVGIDFPQIKGYEFVGWLMDGEPYDCGPVNKDCIMTPVYKEECTLTYLDPLGGVIDELIMLEGDIIKKPEDPERSGYNFTGWKDVYGDSFEFGKPIEKDTIVMAGWAEIPYVRYIEFPVNSYTVKLGKTLQASPIIWPKDYVDKIYFESSDYSIFSVDENGLIKGINQGEAYLIVHTSDKESTIPVFVK